MTAWPSTVGSRTRLGASRPPRSCRRLRAPATAHSVASAARRLAHRRNDRALTSHPPVQYPEEKLSPMPRGATPFNRRANLGHEFLVGLGLGQEGHVEVLLAGGGQYLRRARRT